MMPSSGDLTAKQKGKSEDSASDDGVKVLWW